MNLDLSREKEIFPCRTSAVQLLDENYVCDQIVDGIRNNKRMIMLPPHTVLFYMLKGYDEKKKKIFGQLKEDCFCLDCYQMNVLDDFFDSLDYQMLWIRSLVENKFPHNQYELKYFA